MGCDIHLFVEKKSSATINGNPIWVTADKWANDGSVDYDNQIYQGRNYSLFSILADVRNGYGFAGVDTGEGYKPIDNPRGLPAWPQDCCPEVLAESGRWGVDAHSHSHFTLKELLDYDWTQVTTKRGVVDAKEFVRWMRYDKESGNGPDSYCASVGGGKAETLPQAEGERRYLAALEKTKDERVNDAGLGLLISTAGMSTHFAISWQETYFTSCRDFFSNTLPKLLKLANGDYESVRIVFWFDN